MKFNGRGVIYDSVYKEKLRRIIHEVSKNNMILLTTRSTKKTLELALDIPKKKSDDAFEDLDRLDVKL